MTTDNRTPKQTEAKSSQDFVFTEAQVEAACKAHEFTNAFGPERETRMRAALVAAAGVAPQAESDEQVHFAPYMSATAACGEAVPKGALAVKEGDRLYADTRFTDRRKETTCAECVSRAQIVEHGTVQPSSTVDEAALARVVRSALPYDVEVAPVRKSKTERHFRTVADGDLHVERITKAVAEYLTGGTK